MSILITALLFIIVLGALVFVHELGHFLMAKRAGMEVEEFGFGFPPRLIGKRFSEGGTLYSINAIPLGGFVKIPAIGPEVTEEGADEQTVTDPKPKADTSFSTKSTFQKISVLVAGIIMNLLFAVVLFTAAALIGVDAQASAVPEGATVLSEQVYIASIFEETPAAESGLQIGDQVMSINGAFIDSAAQLQDAIQSDITQQISVLRGQEEVSLEITPERIQNDSEEYIGIGIGLVESVRVRFNLVEAIGYGVTTTWSVLQQIVIALAGLISGAIQGNETADALAGPVGIAALTGEAAQLGLSNLLQFAAILSVNLALFNLLPLPALDGGRLVFVIIAGLRGKPVNERIEGIVHAVGFSLLLLLFLWVTIKDIVALV